MDESDTFVIQELGSGDVVLLHGASREQYLVKISFDEALSSALGAGKLEICRKMLVAGIEAIRSRSSEPWGVIQASALSESELEIVLKDFAQLQRGDLDQERVLH